MPVFKGVFLAETKTGRRLTYSVLFPYDLRKEILPIQYGNLYRRATYRFSVLGTLRTARFRIGDKFTPI